MKRIVFASIAVLLTMGVAQARWFGGGRGCNGGCGVRVSRSVCEPACEPVAPICCKTIQVPQQIMVDKVIQVPAQKIVTPNPDLITYEPVAPVEVRIPVPPVPQPDRIEYRCQPDRVIRTPQAPTIRYQCPRDCQPS